MVLSVTPALVRDALATALTVLIITGLGVRYILVPYLRDNLVRPVKDVRRQVTENHHDAPGRPTVLDRIEDVHDEIRALAHVMDQHMSWSERQASLVDRKIKALRKQAQRRKRDNDDTHTPT